MLLSGLRKLFEMLEKSGKFSFSWCGNSECYSEVKFALRIEQRDKGSNP